ncbi:chitinase domain-containing protein 1 [Momordica charantia]|uniref:Chitinase domain-containing protein 1 n=1 Tax=Momordica charantia TaxID=3673 RepID=A0A6J1D1Z3_MOMCH|nr:chitinase domain-containing protein 1 [Momordica charantia]
MAKKRDRQAASNRRKNQVVSSDQHDIVGDSSSDRRLITIFVVFFVISPAISVLVYFKYASNGEISGAPAYDPGLFKTDINYQEILAEHSNVAENASRRRYDYPVLAYITPWNSRGYDMAKKFNSKFTHLSPVWYDLKSHGSSLVLEGRHNADQGWISELRLTGDALVLPRVVIEAFPTDLLRKKKLKDKAIDLIVTECKEMGYDGIVLESWSRWAAHGILHDPDLRTLALQFINQLGNALHSELESRRSKQRLQLVYVIGPPHSENLQKHDFGPQDFHSLNGAVDGFSLMTYDFSSPQNPGPNAPLNWIRSTLRLVLGTKDNRLVQHNAGKIFLGINFYGYDFSLSGGGGAITGRDYVSLLEKYKPMVQWEKNSAEHYFLYEDDNHKRHAVFYPSLKSIFTRLEEARSLGTGISIWEIGQGLDYFFDLL